MSDKQPIIDFKDLSSKVPGEGLEHLVREIGRRKGFSPTWTGRGADAGRDLFFTEILTGPISSEKITWLVSCKDKAQSGESVSERDLPQPGIKDKVAQHKANGFLLAKLRLKPTSKTTLV
jgi:Restriction endonuclease